MDAFHRSTESFLGNSIKEHRTCLLLPVEPHFCGLCFPTASLSEDVNAHWFICWPKIIINTDGQTDYQVNGDKKNELNCVIKLSLLRPRYSFMLKTSKECMMSLVIPEGWSLSLQWRRVTPDYVTLDLNTEVTIKLLPSPVFAQLFLWFRR